MHVGLIFNLTSLKMPVVHVALVDGSVVELLLVYIVLFVESVEGLQIEESCIHFVLQSWLTEANAATAPTSKTIVKSIMFARVQRSAVSFRSSIEGYNV